MFVGSNIHVLMPGTTPTNTFACEILGVWEFIPVLIFASKLFALEKRKILHITKISSCVIL